MRLSDATTCSIVGAQTCCARAGGYRQPLARQKSFRSVALTLFALLFTGCHLLPTAQPDPAHFYLLAAGTSAGAPAAHSGGTLKIGLNPVDLPAYLHNRALAVRKGASEVTYAEDFRWAESLDDAVARVVRDRLLAAPAVAEVFTAPFPIDEPRDYDVTVHLLSCGGGLDASATKSVAQFSAEFVITRASPNREVLWRKTFTAPEHTWHNPEVYPSAREYDSLARLLGEAVDALGHEIALSLPEKR